MTQKDRQEFAKNRIKTAYETLGAAQILSENGFWNSAVNRLYYAAFYAVKALLVSCEIYTKSHAGTKNQFSQNYIKTKKMDLKYGILFSELFDSRQKGDYENLFDYDAETVKQLLIPVKELIETIEQEVNMLNKQV